MCGAQRCPNDRWLKRDETREIDLWPRVRISSASSLPRLLAAIIVLLGTSLAMLPVHIPSRRGNGRVSIFERVHSARNTGRVLDAGLAGLKEIYRNSGDEFEATHRLQKHLTFQSSRLHLLAELPDRFAQMGLEAQDEP